MIYTQDELLKLIHDTSAVSIWDHAKGPVFWYAANVPGPFYVNTEKVIGEHLSQKLLREITAIVAGTVDTQVRAEQLNQLVLDAFKNSPSWQKLIRTMIARARLEFPLGSFTTISGGERRDWLFSIPFAHTVNAPHLFLFKNNSSYCEQTIKAKENVLHVSDLINNAASFFDSWQPMLKQLHLGCAGNLCVNLRGENGLRRLTDDGQKTVAMLTIDVDFFRRLHAAGLITRSMFEEIAIFFGSSQDWAATYLIGKADLFDANGCDAKSFERLRSFIQNDPWKLRGKHEAFFVGMQKAIEQRLARAA
jgi:hypothetical protein